MSVMASTDQREAKVPYTARFNSEALERLRKLAEADERTLSYMIDKAVREYVRRLDKQARRDEDNNHVE